MSFFKLICIAAGLGLLVFIATQIDVGEAIHQAVRIGWGMAVILGIYFAAFLLDAIAWQVTLPSAPLDFRWLYRVWKIRMAGEVLNTVIPAAGLGGEPLKAIMLKRHYGINYREGITSLILSQTIIVMSLVVFLIGGFSVMLWLPRFPDSLNLVAMVGLAGIILAVVLIVALQNLKVASILGHKIKWLGINRRITETLHQVHDVEERLAAFYRRRPRRFAGALIFSLLAWSVGILEIYYAAYYLGHPITLADAWVVEALVQTVRTGLSFVPAGLGAQEGAFLVVFSALSGTPTLGASVALVRRFREIVWVLWGAVVGLTFYLGAGDAKRP
jgi:uncharacterized protein (TIRG00374 family)